MFFSFEGLDGCGKSTQIELLHKHLTELGLEVVRVREPGGTVLGERIRELLLNEHMCERSELLLFLASRAQLVESVIKPALAAGKVVLADRFAHSSVAYQGCGRGLGFETVVTLNNFATDMVYPDVVFFIDIPPELVTERLSGDRLDRIERETPEFWARVRECYLRMVRNYRNFVLLDGTKTIEELHNEIVKVVSTALGLP